MNQRKEYTKEDEIYMYRCLQLARGGLGRTGSNPLVGAVVVANGEIIGEGFHRKWGEAHAEVNAIRSVKKKEFLSTATIYVNLEPCSHHGKTPPCAELIIRTGIPRVVIGCVDPFPPVSGRGVRMLQEAGIEVVTGCLEQEAREVNRVFITTHTLQRPYILLKWAQSRDGFLDRHRTDASQQATVFSTPATSQIVHKRRSEMQAILVGTRTALLDNPSLTVRSWCGQSPLRLAIDKRGLLPDEAALLDGTTRSLIFTNSDRKNQKNIEYISMENESDALPGILKELGKRNITSVMVEGGSCLLSHFLAAGIWDEIQVETAPILLHHGIKAPTLPENAILEKNTTYPYLWENPGSPLSGWETYITSYRRLNSL
ncbi:MAG: bifunctional diaminohydroxyphosphoribosylaminopyrimidine deaminase/5-amino-6-(5-phosphoribosylamino)uracil reductase RibD [Tannerellaceae bacterium]|nr:bifunctional diaminohydroxyphosphoribosylaminopyrimidine deaminase/5-amino-6-(5-phosphoribosylamino)uracil reductase RibD [Tannerellaceae bacterium]